VDTANHGLAEGDKGSGEGSSFTGRGKARGDKTTPHFAEDFRKKEDTVELWIGVSEREKKTKVCLKGNRIRQMNRTPAMRHRLLYDKGRERDLPPRPKNKQRKQPTRYYPILEDFGGRGGVEGRLNLEGKIYLSGPKPKKKRNRSRAQGRTRFLKLLAATYKGRTEVGKEGPIGLGVC